MVKTIQLKSSELLSEEPTVTDFQNDMNERPGEYAKRGKYIIEFERDLADRNQGRLTVWKPREHNGKFIPNKTSSTNTYYWVGVARRKLEFDSEVPHTVADIDFHFNETLERYEYDGPQIPLEYTITD